MPHKLFFNKYLFNSCFESGEKKSGCPKNANTTSITDKSGKYIKSACLMENNAVDHSSSYVECKKRDMTLFEIDSEMAQTILFQSLTQKYGKQGNATIWVDGVQESDGKWIYVGKSKKTDAFSGLKWAKSHLTGNEYCLVAANAEGEFKVNGGFCNRMKFYVCEFKM